MSFSEFIGGGGTQWGLIAAFIVAAGFIIIAGLKLGNYGDALGERTGMGSGIVGLIFLALVTSLPDLTVSISAALTSSLNAAKVTDAAEKLKIMNIGADLAAGNLLGSDLFNLMIFVIIDLTQGKGALLYKLSRKHLLSAACSLFLMGILILEYALERAGGPDMLVPFLDTGLLMPAIAVAYIASMAVLGKLEKTEHGLDPKDYETVETATEERLLKMGKGRFYATLFILSALIVTGGIWLSDLGERMSLPAEKGGFGLSASFIGTIFLAIATSLPEMVVSYAAVRLKAFDMAAGNVLGSNIFNLAGLFLVDCALRDGSLMALISPALLVTMAMVIMLTNVVCAGLIMRTRRSFMNIGVDVWLLIILYIGGNACLYYLGG